MSPPGLRIGGTSNYRLAGSVSIPGAESTTATTYAIGNLTTPDRVQNVVLNANGLIVVGYQAVWQNTVTNNGRAAIFIGANQQKIGVGSGAATVGTSTEAQGVTEVNDDGIVTSHPGGLVRADGVGAATEVTTGQAIGIAGADGGLCCIFAAAGTYDISIQFKNVAAGTTTVKNRHLWVWVTG